MLAPIAEAEQGGPLFDAGMRALEQFPALVDEVRELSGIDPQLAQTGILRVVGPAGTEAGRRRARVLEAWDCGWLEPEQARKHEPALATGTGTGAGIGGAIWSPREAHVEPGLMTRALAAAAARRGARLELGSEVTGLLREGDRVVGVSLRDRTLAAAEVVLCGGAWTGFFEQEAGAPLPVEPVRGQIVALEAPQPALRSIIWGDEAYLVPRRDGLVLVGATVERAGFDVRTTAEGVARLIGAGSALVPALGACSFERAWAGLRPATPDGLPLIGGIPGVVGLSVAAGHYRNGILLAGLTGLWIAERIQSGALPAEAAAFDPGRFAA
jgi:glycine oxidase